MSNESIVPVFATYDRDSGTIKGIGPLGVPYIVLGGGGGGGGISTISAATDYSTAQLPAQTAAINTKVTNLGIFLSQFALQSAYPASTGNIGYVAYVGSAPPYIQYVSDGAAWGVGGGTGSSVWGTLTGTLASQIDLSTALSYKTAAQGIWNLATNVATAPGGSTFTPASSVYPSNGANFLLCTGSGSQVLDGQTYLPLDYAVMNPALGQWVRVAGSLGSIPNTTKVLIGNGSGSAAAGQSNVDFGAPSAFCLGVHVFIMPAGTIGSNGALTITGTALVAGLTDGFWGYFPANCLNGSNAAGFYWVVMSSPSTGGTGTVYNTTYTPGTTSPAIPSAPVAFSGTTGSAYTNAVGSYIVLAQVALGTAPFGTSGFLRQRGLMMFNTGATTHNIQTRYNGSVVGIQASSSSTNTQFSFQQTVQNAGRFDRQTAANPQVGDIYSGSAGIAFSSVDTSGAVTWAIAATLGATSDWVSLLSIDVSANYAV